jgi:predicted SnoaL-like aldol condensation-catalyzing enzyme
MEAQINGHNVLSEDIFRFDGNHIIEMWDLGQQIPDNMPNENGMF